MPTTNWLKAGDAVDPIASIPDNFKLLSGYKGWRIAWTDWIPPHKEYGISAHVVAFHPELGDRGLIVTIPDFRVGTYIEGDTLPEPFGDPLLIDNGVIVIENEAPDAPMVTINDIQKLAMRKAMECVEDYTAGKFPCGDRLVIGNRGAYADWGKPYRGVAGFGDGELSKAVAARYEAEQARPGRLIKNTLRAITYDVRHVIRRAARLFKKKPLTREPGALEKKMSRGL